MNLLGGIFRSVISIRWEVTVSWASQLSRFTFWTTSPHPNRKCIVAIAVFSTTTHIYKHPHHLPRQMVCGVDLGKGSMNVAWTGDDWQRGANPPQHNPPQHLRHPRVHVGFPLPVRIRIPLADYRFYKSSTRWKPTPGWIQAILWVQSRLDISI